MPEQHANARVISATIYFTGIPMNTNNTLTLSRSEILAAITRLFEKARQANSETYDAKRFLAFLTAPPAPGGNRVADTFAGRRRFVRFMQSVQLQFGICFTNQEWERGYTLEDFANLVEAKIKRPADADKLSQKRLRESRNSLVTDPLKFGLFAIPILVASFAMHNVLARIILALTWIGIVSLSLFLNMQVYFYSKKLLARIQCLIKNNLSAG
jgi:hypothetical protein